MCFTIRAPGASSPTPLTSSSSPVPAITQTPAEDRRVRIPGWGRGGGRKGGRGSGKRGGEFTGFRGMAVGGGRQRIGWAASQQRRVPLKP